MRADATRSETPIVKARRMTGRAASGKTAPALLVRNLVQACEAAGIPPAALLDGIELDTKALSRPFGRVPWRHMIELHRRLEKITTPEQRWQIGALHASSLPHLNAIARLAASPRSLLHLMVAGTRQLWKGSVVEERDLPDGRLEICVRFQPDDWPVKGIWQITTAFWATAPTLLGLPPAEVEEHISIPRGSARWVLRLPAARASRARFEPEAETVAAEVLELARGLAHALQRGDATHRGECDALRLQRRLGLTLAEAKVADRLASGEDLTSIATALHVTRETVRTHLKRTYSKTGTRRQAELVALVLRVARDDD